MKIHILGPSGSGTTTLGKAICESFNITHFDSDDFFWIKTEPPFTTKRPLNDRIDLLIKTLNNNKSWVLSGSSINWGDYLLENSDLIIHLYINQDVRMKRLLTREIERYGDRIKPGNDMYKAHIEFIDWARSYDTGGLEIRSKMSELNWLKRAKCQILNINSELSIEEEIKIVEKVIDKL
jgi:adenylate kinase family enzyme